MNRKGVTFKSFILALFAMTVLGSAITLLLASFNTNLFQDQIEYTNQFNKSSELATGANDMLQQVKSNSTSNNDVVGFVNLGSISTMGIIFDQFSIFGNYMSRIASVFDPSEFGIMAIYIDIIIASILFSLLILSASAFFRYPL